MVSRAHPSQPNSADEVFVHSEPLSLSLCLLINRRTRTMRVVDFRAGASPAKLRAVLTHARREGVEKVCTVVERDEVATWVKLGFVKEGTIPSFYKRSDAFLLGWLVSEARVAAAERHPDADDAPEQSEMRLRAARPVGPAANRSASSPVDAAERTLTAAKRLVKEDHGRARPAARIEAASEGEMRKALAAAARSGRALTGFEPFGRDGERRYFVAHVRGSPALHASTETQTCFSNAYLELLEAPRSDAEALATTAVLGAIGEALLAEGIVTCFSLAPSDDVRLAAAYVRNGFRRTGLLSSHLVLAGKRRDGVLWSRKLANPADG